MRTWLLEGGSSCEKSVVLGASRTYPNERKGEGLYGEHVLGGEVDRILVD